MKVRTVRTVLVNCDFVLIGNFYCVNADSWYSTVDDPVLIEVIVSPVCEVQEYVSQQCVVCTLRQSL